MDQIMKKEQIADELAQRTGFYKKNMRDVVNALEDIVLENLQSATFEQDSEFHLAPGIVIGGKRTPERESIDPRDRSPIITPEKVVPYAEFKMSIRKKLYEKSKKKGKKG